MRFAERKATHIQVTPTRSLPLKQPATLVPKAGSEWLPVATVLQRAAVEFACVITDHERAVKRLAVRLVAENPNIDHRTADEYLGTLAEAVEMICADDRHTDVRFLKCFVVPERPIEIAYHFDGHEEASAGLLDRLARVLDYVIAD